MFIKNFSRINWSATFKALIQSLTAKKSKKVKSPTVSSEIQSSADQSSHQVVAPAITVSPISEDAEIEAWLNKITEKASRTSKPAANKPAANKPAAKKAAAKKPAAKKAVVTKKAAPKSTKKR